VRFHHQPNHGWWESLALTKATTYADADADADADAELKTSGELKLWQSLSAI